MSATIRLDLSGVPHCNADAGLDAVPTWYNAFSIYLGAQGFSALARNDWNTVRSDFPVVDGAASGAAQRDQQAVLDRFVARTGCPDANVFARFDRACYTTLQYALSPTVDADGVRVNEGWPEMLANVIRVGEDGSYKDALDLIIARCAGDSEAQALTIRRGIRGRFNGVEDCPQLITCIAYARTESATAGKLKPAGATWSAEYTDADLCEFAGDALIRVAQR